MILFFRHRWNIGIFPVTQNWYLVKIPFVSCTLWRYHRLSWRLQFWPIGNSHHRIARVYLFITNNNIIFEDKIRMYVRACNTLYLFFHTVDRPKSSNRSCHVFVCESNLTNLPSPTRLVSHWLTVYCSLIRASTWVVETSATATGVLGLLYFGRPNNRI